MIAIDYTNRDYDTLREALISRVKLRVPTWQGTDPSDFGVALVESFAYMGDVLNYYIDRMANESYIATATQRQSLLNLATMFGYTVGGYTAALVDVTFTNNDGYKGQIGGSILTSGTATIIVPNDNPFTTVGNTIQITGLARSEYNGTWLVSASGVNGYGQNTVSYLPSFTVTGASYSSGAGTKTYIYTNTQGNKISVGQLVYITGISPSGYNLGTTSSGIAVTAIGVDSGSGNATFTVSDATSVASWSSGGTVKFSNIATDGNVVGFINEVGSTTVPAGTQLSADVVYDNVVTQTYFTTLADSNIAYKGTAKVIAQHGINVSTYSQNASTGGSDIAGELLGQSDGTPDQMFTLSETVVDPLTIKIYVNRTGTYELWTQVDYLEDYSPSDAIYSVELDADNNVFIKFGDGISGTIPPTSAQIKATYIVGGGAIGNIPAYAIKSISAVPGSSSETSIKSTIQATNIVQAAGGSDPESDTSIRYNAPKALRALNRAVTLEDFANLSLSVSKVAKAKAIAAIAKAEGKS